MIPSKSLRQGFLILFSILIIFIGINFLKMSYFECLLVIAIAGIIMKLTDIEETLENKK